MTYEQLDAMMRLFGQLGEGLNSAFGGYNRGKQEKKDREFKAKQQSHQEELMPIQIESAKENLELLKLQGGISRSDYDKVKAYLDAVGGPTGAAKRKIEKEDLERRGVSAQTQKAEFAASHMQEEWDLKTREQLAHINASEASAANSRASASAISDNKRIERNKFVAKAVLAEIVPQLDPEKRAKLIPILNAARVGDPLTPEAQSLLDNEFIDTDAYEKALKEEAAQKEMAQDTQHLNYQNALDNRQDNLRKAAGDRSGALYQEYNNALAQYGVGTDPSSWNRLPDKQRIALANMKGLLIKAEEDERKLNDVPYLPPPPGRGPLFDDRPDTDRATLLHPLGGDGLKLPDLSGLSVTGGITGLSATGGKMDNLESFNKLFEDPRIDFHRWYSRKQKNQLGPDETDKYVMGQDGTWTDNATGYRYLDPQTNPFSAQGPQTLNMWR